MSSTHRECSRTSIGRRSSKSLLVRTSKATNMSTYFATRYALWLDFRSCDSRKLHASGSRVENASEGVTLQLEKRAQAAGTLSYLLMDGQLNIGNFKLISAMF